MVDCGSGNTGNRFVCPSDRQLALRAKLNTGWSMKTATLGINPPKSPPLGDAENETIKSVIKRAEQLDINEKERIVGGDLQGISQSSISLIVKKVSELLAGLLEQFVKFPDDPQEHQINVQKFFQIANFPGISCCIDGTHILIKNPGGEIGEVFRNRKGQFSLNIQIGKLVDKLEAMRRNALGRSPSQCLLCGMGFGMLRAQKVFCMDCKRFACQKCAIEGPLNKNHCNSKEQWLCLICAETREIWKKSGAWFFKCMPKYILPSNNNRFSRSKSLRKSKKYKDDDSSSDEERFWAKNYKRASVTIENTLGWLIKKHPHSQNIQRPKSMFWDDIHRFQTQLHFYTKRRSSRCKDKKCGNPSMNFELGNYKYRSGIFVFVTLLYIRDQERYSFNASSSESVLYREIDPLKSVSNLSTLNELTNSDEFDGDRTTESSGMSRRESTVSRSLSDWNWTDSRSDDKISPGSSSVNSSIFKGLSEQKQVDNPLGVIELSVSYDYEANTLNCTIHRAKNLIPMDICGLSDPFCKLNILPSPKVSTRLRTKTVHKTRNPEFNEKLTFYDISETNLKEKSLHIIVVDDDKYGHDYMGETRISLAKLRKQKTLYITAPLENLRPEQKGPLPAVELNEWFDDIWSRGQILVSLCYSTRKRALLVTVVRCINLLPMDNNGLSDPFVKLHLKSDQYHKKYKTSVKWKNLNPEFNEEFAFETRPTELYTQSLHLAVFDKDYGKSNDYLGGLILGGNGSKGRRLKHWLDMIKYPDHRHEQWHNLTEDVLE